MFQEVTLCVNWYLFEDLKWKFIIFKWIEEYWNFDISLYTCKEKIAQTPNARQELHAKIAWLIAYFQRQKTHNFVIVDKTVLKIFILFDIIFLFCLVETFAMYFIAIKNII